MGATYAAEPTSQRTPSAIPPPTTPPAKPR